MVNKKKKSTKPPIRSSALKAATSNLQTVIFLIPLPNSIPVPDGYHVSFQEPDDGQDDGVIRFKTPTGLSMRIKERLLFRQVESYSDTRPFEVSATVADELSRYKGKREDGVKKMGNATVVYASVITSRGEIDQETYTVLFDKILDTLRSYLKSYYVVDRTPIELPSRMNLPPGVLVHRENVDSNGDLLAEDHQIKQTIFMLNGSNDRFVGSEEPIALDKLASAVHPDITMGARVINPTLDTYREASLAYRRGETISASILFASSVEVFLDTLLLYLMWEEGKRPEEAYEVMFSTKMCECNDCKAKMTTTLDRVNGGLYSSRIDGDWSKKSELMTKWRSLAELRNRVVHTGHEPDIRVLDEQVKIVPRIQTIVTDYLVGAVDRYPLTAYFFAGQDGLERRGLSSDLNNYIDVDEFKPNSLSEQFLNWKYEVERLGSGKLKKSKDEICRLAYLIHPSGQKKWILYDPELRLFRIINDQEIDKGLALNLALIEKNARKNGLVQSIIIDIHDVVPVIKTAKKIWYPMYRTSSSLSSIDRSPASYLLPLD